VIDMRLLATIAAAMIIAALTHLAPAFAAHGGGGGGPLQYTPPYTPFCDTALVQCIEHGGDNQ
jgi:hypothetical protein